VVQGIGFLILLERQGVLPALSPFQLGVNLLVVTAGSMLLMWLGELISEFGLGNERVVSSFLQVSLPACARRITTFVFV